MTAKPKPTKPKPNKAYKAWVAQRPCLVCGGPANVHHVVGHSFLPGRLPKDDRVVTPLCKAHHQGDNGVHGLGSHRKFFEVYEIDLLFEAQALFRRYSDE